MSTTTGAFHSICLDGQNPSLSITRLHDRPKKGSTYQQITADTNTLQSDINNGSNTCYQQNPPVVGWLICPSYV